MVTNAVARGDHPGHLRARAGGRFTAVCEVPPPAAWHRRCRPPRWPAPVASNSRFGPGRGSPRAANARPAAMVSVKLMSAMPSAPGHSGAPEERSGSMIAGNPAGICPTMATPAACSPSSRRDRDAGGHRDQRRRRARQEPFDPHEDRDHCDADGQRRHRGIGQGPPWRQSSRTNPPLRMCMPSNFGIWSTTITSPIPALNPTSTGSEMKLAMKPSRSSEARTGSRQRAASRVRPRRAVQPVPPGPPRRVPRREYGDGGGGAHAQRPRGPRTA